MARPNGLLVLCTTLAPEEHVLARPNVLLVLCTTLALEKRVLARPNVLLVLCTTLALEECISIFTIHSNQSDNGSLYPVSQNLHG